VGNFNIVFLFTPSPYIFKMYSITMLSSPHHISWGLILILSCYINRCFTWDLFASILTTTVYAHHIPSMQATCPNRLFLLDFKILITHCEVYSSLICGFLCPPVTASLLGPYNVLSTLSQATRVCILPLICKTLPPPLFNQTTYKVIIFSILIFTCLYSRWENSRCWTERSTY
jgi:hypothetical protein